MATTVPATTSTTSSTSFSGSSAQAVPNDPRVHKFNTDDDTVVVDDDASSRSQRPQEEEEPTKEEEENSSSEWEKGYVPRASLHPMRRGSVYANLISQGGGGNSGVMASDAKSWHMSYLKVIVYSLVCT